MHASNAAVETLDEFELLQDLLSMAFVSVKIDTIRGWDETQHKAAKNWAIQHRLIVAGHNLKAIPLPEFLAQFHPVPPANITLSMMTPMQRKRPKPGEQILLKRADMDRPQVARYLDTGHCYSIAGRVLAIDATDSDRWIGIDQLVGVGSDG